MPSIPQSLLWISLVVLWLFVLVPMLINKRDTVRRTSDIALATRVLNTKSRLIRRSGPAAGHRHDPFWRRGDTDSDPTFDSDLDAKLAGEFEDGHVSQSVREARTEEFFPGGYGAQAYSAEAYSAEAYSAEAYSAEAYSAEAYSAEAYSAEAYSAEAYSAVAHSAEDAAMGEERTRTRTRSLVVIAAETEQADPNYLDVDFVEEDSGALPVGRMAGVEGTVSDTPIDEGLAPEVDSPITAEEVVIVDESPFVEELPLAEALPPGEASSQGGAPLGATDSEELVETARSDESGAEREYEYVQDTSGLEDVDELEASAGPSGRRRRLDSTATAAAVTARKYLFRKRVLTAMAVLLLLTAVLSVTVDPGLWQAFGAVAGAVVLYLAYLRRQTRIEEQVRRRREQRVARSRASERPGEEAVAERVVPRDRRDFDVVPTRIQRPGAVVLDIDDEDPIFEHLDEVAYTRGYRHGHDHDDLPRAAGQ